MITIHTGSSRILAKPPEFITQTTDTPGSLTGSQPTPLGGRAALTLSGAHPEDDAEYFSWLMYSGVPHTVTVK
jgi:hypothetical protein